MSKLLFVHQNFPGQFGQMTRRLAERGHQVVAIGEAGRLKERPSPHPAIKRLGYAAPAPAGPKTHHYLRSLEAHTRRGQSVYRVCQDLLRSGFTPEIVVAHPGWGEALFLRDAFPKARIVHYCEYFYSGYGGDVGFDPEFPVGVDDVLRVRMKNATQMIGFDSADAGIAPTEWQRSRYPADWQTRIACIHDGIDTRAVAPDPAAKLGAGETALSAADEVLTFVARNLEPYRGFHVFMRAVPRLLAARPRLKIVIVGGDEVSYGRAPAKAANWREALLAEWPAEVDRQRVHFFGRLPYAEYLKVLQISSLHLYLTYPFVLSWSMLEALAVGCVVLGSNTPPVAEVIRDGDNAFLTDFFDVDALVRRAGELLDLRSALGPIRAAARQTVLNQYNLDLCLPRLLEFIGADRAQLT